ncbi:Next to BRCA1 protein 1 protein, variant 2 [Balamuthia mandrillaris]
MPVAVKAKYGDDLRRVTVEDAITLEELHALLLSVFGPLPPFSLKYEDEEGDLVSISSDVEVTEALNLASQRQNNTLRLFLSDQQRTAPSAPSSSSSAASASQPQTSSSTASPLFAASAATLPLPHHQAENAAQVLQLAQLLLGQLTSPSLSTTPPSPSSTESNTEERVGGATATTGGVAPLSSLEAQLQPLALQLLRSEAMQQALPQLMSTMLPLFMRTASDPQVLSALLPLVLGSVSSSSSAPSSNSTAAPLFQLLPQLFSAVLQPQNNSNNRAQQQQQQPQQQEQLYPSLGSFPSAPTHTPLSGAQPQQNATRTGSTGSRSENDSQQDQNKPKLAARFMEDATYPPGASCVDARKKFIKAWRVKNEGTTDWHDISLSFAGGYNLSALTRVIVPPTKAGDTTLISVPMEAPLEAGNYVGHWRLTTRNGQSFGPRLWMDITVVLPSVSTPPLSSSTSLSASLGPSSFSSSSSSSHSPSMSSSLSYPHPSSSDGAQVPIYHHPQQSPSHSSASSPSYSPSMTSSGSLSNSAYFQPVQLPPPSAPSSTSLSSSASSSASVYPAHPHSRTSAVRSLLFSLFFPNLSIII